MDKRGEEEGRRLREWGLGVRREEGVEAVVWRGRERRPGGKSLSEREEGTGTTSERRN